jgi:hypothetical protein
MFALRVIDDNQTSSSSGLQAPIEFMREGMAVRHCIMAAATALLSEPQLRAQLLVPDPIGIGEQLRLLLSRLNDADRVALLERSRQWPLAWRGYLDLILAAGLEAEITKPLRPRPGGSGPAQSGAREFPEAPSLLI